MKKLKSRLNSGNMCYHWVQSVLSSWLLSTELRFYLLSCMDLNLVSHAMGGTKIEGVW